MTESVFWAQSNPYAVPVQHIIALLGVQTEVVVRVVVGESFSILWKNTYQVTISSNR